ncbi:glycosyltransferase family 39 protein [Danxiaibacter flavus]|uniref:Glycosyltransferase family 39 protein n=1 Tax=Danxiaibacter flavus TaxID=3049108 RepID=A0ABV3ZF93_9BACT|nr:glycosyltransferase family 39 protein [Chitinophagaceae bacterium DXS]
MISTHTYKENYFWQLFALLSIILLFRLGATPIYILDEAKNSQCAREMLMNSNGIIPTFNGELRTDKPPLHYFFMMAAYKIFGQTPFAARFFSAIMGLLTVLVSYHYTKKFLNAASGFCVALVLACSTHFLFEFRLAVPDPYLIFFITLGLFSGFSWLQTQKPLDMLLTSVSLAMATLAKGPIAIALPGFCFLLWIVLKKKWPVLFSWSFLSGIIIYFIIAIPWYYAVYKATNGEWIKGFFVDHNLNRFSDPQEGHGGFFLVTILFVLIGLIPFMSFLGEVIKARKELFKNDFILFCGIVVLAFVVFFSISSTKLPNYPMPCYPFAAVILGVFIYLLINGAVTSKKYPLYILTVFTFILPVAGYFAIKQEAEAAHVSWIALTLFVCPVILFGYFFIIKTADWQKRIAVIAFAFSLFNITGLHYVYPVLYSQNPVTKTITTVKNYQHIYSYDTFNPAYRFYLDKDVPVTTSLPELKHWLDSTPNALIITRTYFVDTLKALPLQNVATHHDLFELPTTVIFKADAKPES